MSFGVTLQGFVTKRLADIAAETELKWKEKFGDSFDLEGDTPEGQIKGILDERESTIWELAEDVYDCGTVAFSQGVCLDNVVALTGKVREGSRSTVVDKGRAFGVLSTVVPDTTIFSKEGDPTATFKPNAPFTISIPPVDEIQTISFSLDPDSGKFNIVFPEGTTADIAHDDSIGTAQGIIDSVLGAGNSTLSGAIDDTSGLSITFIGTLAGLPRVELTITGNTLTSGGPAVVVTPGTTTEGSKATSPLVVLIAVTPGPTSVPAGTLNVIDTPVIGLEEFTNEEDAIIGRNIEQDPDLKLRRAQELQIAGAATLEAIRADILEVENVTEVLVFENDSDIIDIDGRPPHTIDIVVQGGADQDIIDAIFLTKAAGIGTTGDISGTAIDSQGFGHTIEFSRPTEIEIFVDVAITKDTNKYPVDGDTQVENAILAFGNLLIIGEDIIVFGSDPLSCSFKDIPGITDFVIKVSRDAGPPTTDDNIIIAPREISDFDSSRVTVTS